MSDSLFFLVRGCQRPDKIPPRVGTHVFCTLVFVTVGATSIPPTQSSSPMRDVISNHHFAQEGQASGFTKLADIIDKNTGVTSAKRVSEEGAAPSPVKHGGSMEVASGGSGGFPQPSPGKDIAAPKEDVRAARNRMSQTIRKGIDADYTKAEKALRSASAILAEGDILANHDFFATTDERACAVLLYIGANGVGPGMVEVKMEAGICRLANFILSRQFLHVLF